MLYRALSSRSLYRRASKSTTTATYFVSNFSRSMHTFAVYAPDKTDEGAYERRLSVRPTHLDDFKKAKEAGLKCVLGGAILTPESITGGERKMVGSILFIEAESLEAARKIIEGDIYYTSGVWDPEKLVIAPFQVAVNS